MNLVPIEHGGQRVLTTQQLAEFYGEPPVKLQQNFSNNRQRYAEGEHFFRIEHGQEGYSKFSSSPYATQPIYLWTEKGALYHAKSLNTDRAWETYDQLVDTYFRVRQAQSIEDLIIMQAQSMKQLKAEVAAQGEQIQTIKETLIEVDEDWRRDINLKLNRIAYKRGGGQEYSNIKTQSYDILEDRAHCDLATRLRNLRARLELRGETQTEINNVNYLDVIEADPRIKEIYTTIVKELAIKYLA